MKCWLFLLLLPLINATDIQENGKQNLTQEPKTLWQILGVHKEKTLYKIECELSSIDKDGREVKLRINMTTENTEIIRTTWDVLGKSEATGEASLETHNSNCSKLIPLSQIAAANETAWAMSSRSNDLVSKGVTLEPGSAASLHHMNNVVELHHLHSDVKSSSMLLLWQDLLRKKQHGQNEKLRVHHEDICVSVVESDVCTTHNPKYRTFDGSCNNKLIGACGKAKTPLQRLAPANYADGIYEIPMSVKGGKLPNVRQISLELLSTQAVDSQTFTILLMQWGQAVSHDISFSSTKQTTLGPHKCCSDNGSQVLPNSLRAEACFPIEISESDPIYKECNMSCMEFVRSLTSVPTDCILGPAQPMNIVTSYLDCSIIYGNSKSISDSLRMKTGGQLNTTLYKNKEFMPRTKKSPKPCEHPTSDDIDCYVAGDRRVNQNPLMTSFHVLLLREHNRIARTLITINPHWDDEQLFQETRRILIALYQHITYNEMLPIIIGKSAHKKYFSEHYYEETLCMGTYVEFATGAYRFLHTLIHGELWMVTKDHKKKKIQLSDYYNRPSLVREHFEEFVLGLATQVCREPDPFMDDQIADKLFRGKNKCGLSLPSMDIQRGRDHGVATYNEMRRVCGFPKAKNFSDLIGAMPQDAVEILSKLYADPDDIDLFVGGSLEISVPNAMVGPVFHCIIVKQFLLARDADLYFYTSTDLPFSFTPDQLEEIKKASASKLICDHGNVNKIQENVFLQSSISNPIVPCHTIPSINLELWRDENEITSTHSETSPVESVLLNTVSGVTTDSVDLM